MASKVVVVVVAGVAKVTRQCPQTATFLKRKESRSGIEPRYFSLAFMLLNVHGGGMTY